MSPFCKTIVVVIICCQVFSISCKTKKQSATKGGTAVINDKDSVLNQFKRFFNDTLPLPHNYVNDYESIFTPPQEKYLNHLLDSFERKTAIRIAVVSFDQIMVTQQNFQALTLQLANAWGVGSKGKNNGILIGICAGHKRMRIENSRAIEKILSDSATKVIVDSSFLPSFKIVDYFTGTLNGVNSIMKKITILQQ